MTLRRDEVLPLDDREVRQPGGARRRVPGVGVAVAQHVGRIGFERRPHPGPDEHAAERLVPGGDRLGEGREVGHHPVVLGGEPRAEPAEAGDHLVEDQQRAVAVAQAAEVGEVVG